jgi:hypothetical protein
MVDSCGFKLAVFLGNISVEFLLVSVYYVGLAIPTHGKDNTFDTYRPCIWNTLGLHQEWIFVIILSGSWCIHKAI